MYFHHLACLTTFLSFIFIPRGNYETNKCGCWGEFAVFSARVCCCHWREIFRENRVKVKVILNINFKRKFYEWQTSNKHFSNRWTFDYTKKIVDDAWVFFLKRKKSLMTVLEPFKRLVPDLWKFMKTLKMNTWIESSKVDLRDFHRLLCVPINCVFLFFSTSVCISLMGITKKNSQGCLIHSCLNFLFFSVQCPPMWIFTRKDPTNSLAHYFPLHCAINVRRDSRAVTFVSFLVPFFWRLEHRRRREMCEME